MIRISVAFNLLHFAFGYFNTILFLCVSFHSFLVFVLSIKDKGPKCSDSELNSCAIYIYVTLRQEKAYISSISAAS